MISDTNTGGQMAAGAIAPNNANDDNKVVPNEQFKDNTNAGEVVSNISESRPETPSRRSDLPLPPSERTSGCCCRRERRAAADRRRPGG